MAHPHGRRGARQRVTSAVEHIVLVVLIALAAIAGYEAFGKTIRCRVWTSSDCTRPW
jgi:hypothetical protein